MVRGIRQTLLGLVVGTALMWPAICAVAALPPTPPGEADLPPGELGEIVRLGKALVEQTDSPAHQGVCEEPACLLVLPSECRDRSKGSDIHRGGDGLPRILATGEGGHHTGRPSSQLLHAEHGRPSPAAREHPIHRHHCVHHLAVAGSAYADESSRTPRSIFFCEAANRSRQSESGSGRETLPG